MATTLQAGARLGPYEIRGALGRGGMGEVYLGHDTRLGRPVAIKVLGSNRAGDAVAADRFLREARAASALNHPHIVTIHDIGEGECGRFLVMEYIEGRTLRAACPDLDAEGAARAIAGAARALAAAHGAGIVHRDIKPENVMLRADGYVKVLDFGLARVAPQPVGDETATIGGSGALTQPGFVVGTVDYMSPEQTRGGEMTGASDVFSLGVVFYELTTRRHPFKRAQWFETMHAIANEAPQPPSRFNAALLAEFDELILEMLEKDPRRRPSAAEVAERLSGPRRATPTLPAAPRRFVGRGAERARLLDAAEAAWSGRGGMVMISGEPGLGKTTLLETAVADVAERRRFLTARGRCSERLAGAEPYLPWIEMVEALAASPGPAEALRQHAPSWYRGGSSAGAPAGPITPDRAQREIVRFFEECARETPLLLAIEDLHWSDAPSVDLLAYLGSHIAGVRVLLVGTYRPSDLALAKHPLRRVTLDLQSRGVCSEIALPLLSEDDVRRYLDLEFPGHALPDGLAHLIHARTDGSPLFMADILRYLRTRGDIAQRNGVWTLAAPLEDAGRDLPESVRGMIERKLAQLSDPDRKLLQAAAVQGAQFDTATLAEAARLDAGEVEERLESLERTLALVRFAGDGEFPDGTLTLRYAFQHALYQNALYDSVRVTQKAAIARAVAEALLARRTKGTGDIDAQLAFLFELARDADRAARHCAGAAWHACAKGAAREAVAMARRGLDLAAKLPESAERDGREAELLIAMGVPLTMMHGFSAPELQGVYGRARELAAAAGNRPLLLAALTGLFSWHGMAGDCQASLANAEAVAEVARAMDDVDEIVNADRALGFILAHMGRFDDAVAALGRVAERYDPKRFRFHVARYAFDPLAGASSFLGWMRTARGDLAGGLAAGRAAIERAQAIGGAQSEGLAWCFNAFLHELRRDYVACRECADTAIRFAEARELAIFPQYGRIWSGWAAACMGERDGVARLRQGLSELEAMGANLSRPHFLALLAEAEWTAGNAEEARARIDESLEFAVRSANTYYVAPAWRLKGEMAQTPAAAEECLRRALDTADAQRAPWFALRAAVALARLLREQGRDGEIRALLEARVAPFSEFSGVADVDAARALIA